MNSASRPARLDLRRARLKHDFVPADDTAPSSPATDEDSADEDMKNDDDDDDAAGGANVHHPSNDDATEQSDRPAPAEVAGADTVGGPLSPDALQRVSVGPPQFVAAADVPAAAPTATTTTASTTVTSPALSSGGGQAAAVAGRRWGGGPLPPTEVFPPCRVGRYLLLDQLDERPMYKCVNIDTEEELTCKIVNNERRDTLSAHFRVDSHENIGELAGVLVGERHTYLFFEPSHGDLHSYVRTRRRLREGEARHLFRQVASAVQHCHDNGVVLHDLKLRRFVFKDPQRTQLKLETLEDAVLLDEGHDDILDDKHGCPAYVSPEILMTDDGYSGRAADVWSLGIMLYAMLVGRYPFHDAEHNTLFNKIRGGHYTIPDTVSARARCLIRCLLRRVPEERPSAEDVLRHPWLRCSPNPLQPEGVRPATAAAAAAAADKNDQVVPSGATTAAPAVACSLWSARSRGGTGPGFIVGWE